MTMVTDLPGKGNYYNGEIRGRSLQRGSERPRSWGAASGGRGVLVLDKGFVVDKIVKRLKYFDTEMIDKGILQWRHMNVINVE